MTKVIARVHQVHLMNVDWAPGGRQPSDQTSRLGLWVRRKLAAVIHIHHCHCYYYSAHELILILPSHEGWKAELTWVSCFSTVLLAKSTNWSCILGLKGVRRSGCTFLAYIVVTLMLPLLHYTAWLISRLYHIRWMWCRLLLPFFRCTLPFCCKHAAVICLQQQKLFCWFFSRRCKDIIVVWPTMSCFADWLKRRHVTLSIIKWSVRHGRPWVIIMDQCWSL